MSPQKAQVKLYVNIFPSTNFDWDCLKFDIDRKILYVKHLFEFHSSLKVKTVPKFWCFKSDDIFINECPSNVYKTVINLTIDKAYFGIDSVIISCGQNCSGKTFTLSGFYNQFEQRGIIPRFVVDLFLQKENRQNDVSTEILLSVVDIYGSSICDLLSNPTTKYKDKKQIKTVKIKSTEQCLEYLFRAEARRMIIDQKTYKAHSASNIVTFKIKTISFNRHDPYNKISEVHFVDLAGVETIHRNPLTSYKDKQDQGRANVAKTLMGVFALQSGELKTSRVKTNMHKISQYLDRSLSSGALISLICQVRPNHEDLMITISLLKFGLAFQGIRILPPHPLVELNHERLVENMQDQIKDLQDELLLRNLWGEIYPMKITQDRIDFAKRSVKSFMLGEMSDKELLSLVNDCSLVLNVMKSFENEAMLSGRFSTASQTDEDMLVGPWLMVDEKESLGRSGSILKRSTGKSIDSPSKAKALLAAQLSKHVSFETKKSSIKTKSEKPKLGKKDDKKSKKEEKPIMVEEEVQVNLIEPKAKMPNIGSREALWAEFMIANPEIHELLNTLTNITEEKEKNYQAETVKWNYINQSLKHTELELNKLASFRHIDFKEVYSKEGNLVIPEEESELVQELKRLQKQTEEIKQSLIEAQTLWLDVLKKTNCEKQIIDEKFTEFCKSNELVELQKEMISYEQCEGKFKENLAILEFPTVNTEVSDNTHEESSLYEPVLDNLKKNYFYLQNKYLKLQQP